MPDATIQEAARQLVALLAPACARVTVAGSIRRGKPDPHDIEVVLEPGDLFDFQWNALMASGDLLPDPEHLKDGPRYARVLFLGHKADIFIVRPPAQYGLLLFIRTGPASFGHRALAQWKRLSDGGYSKDGCLHHADGRPEPTPEEADVFRALGWSWVEPENRRG